MHVRCAVGVQMLSLASLLATYAQSAANTGGQMRSDLRGSDVYCDGNTIFCGLVPTLLRLLEDADG